MRNQPISRLSPLVLEQKLREVHLFSSLDAEQLKRIQINMQHTCLDDGEYLFKHGEAAKRFFVLFKGHIKLTRLSAEGSEKVIEIISAGESFAEALMFMSRPNYPVSAQAIGSTEVFGFDNKEFLSILSESFDTSLKIMADMSKRLRLWLNEIDNLTLQNATYRLISYLLYQLPDECTGNYEVNFEVPKHVIASRLSIKPETLSRILLHLSKDDLITVSGRVVQIHDVERMRQYTYAEANTPTQGRLGC